MPRIDAPLLVRLFLVLLLSVMTVQVVNFTLIAFLGFPIPRLYSVSQVAHALQSGVDPDKEVQVANEMASPVDVDPRAERIRSALARAMGVPANQVRIKLEFPLQGDVDLSSIGLAQPPRPATKDPGHTFVVGDFTAAVQQADGRWRTARVQTHEPSILTHFAIVLVIAALTVAPIAWALSRQIGRPFAKFAAAAERLGRDPRAEPMAVRGPYEIREAASAFNRMQGRLNRYVEDRILLIAAIAHDLRTPLMRLSLRLEHAPEQLRKSSEADIADMDSMIASATAFVRDMTSAPQRRLLDLRSLIESVTDDLVDGGRSIPFPEGEPIVMEGDAVGLKSLVSNLIGNALKYAGDAHVVLSRDGDDAVIAVRDTGPGIAEEDLDRVFEPFFRGETSRSRETGGSGLGLASVRAVAHAHGGYATVSNHPDGGVLAQVFLPI